MNTLYRSTTYFNNNYNFSTKIFGNAHRMVDKLITSEIVMCVEVNIHPNWLESAHINDLIIHLSSLKWCTSFSKQSNIISVYISGNQWCCTQRKFARTLLKNPGCDQDVLSVEYKGFIGAFGFPFGTFLSYNIWLESINIDLHDRLIITGHLSKLFVVQFHTCTSRV